MPQASAATAGTFCIACRYALIGIDSKSVCPECGRPVADSLRRPADWPAVWPAAVCLAAGVVVGVLSMFAEAWMFLRQNIHGATVGKELALLLPIGPAVNAAGYVLFARASRAAVHGLGKRTTGALVAGSIGVVAAIICVALAFESLSPDNSALFAALVGAMVLLMAVRNQMFLFATARLREPFDRTMLPYQAVTVWNLAIAICPCVIIAGTLILPTGNRWLLALLAPVAAMGWVLYTIAAVFLMFGLARHRPNAVP